MPEVLIRKFRIYAASHNESMSALMVEAIQRMIDQDQHNASARRRFSSRIRNAPGRGTQGAITWTRDELHER
jgi:hypothetical protein